MGVLATLVLLSVAVLVVCQRWLQYLENIRSIRNHPGLRTLFNHRITALLRPIPYITAASSSFSRKHGLFAYYGVDIISVVSIIPSGVGVIVSDPDAIREVVGARARFPKPVHLYKSLSFFGGNIVVSEHEEWKNYRKIAAPAFSEKNSMLVWRETANVVNGMFEIAWANKEQVVVDNALDFTTTLTLFIIGAAGFGKRIAWDESELPPGHEMTFKETLVTVSEGVMLKIALPKWAKHLSASYRRVDLAFSELEKYMQEMIETRRFSQDKGEKHDLFSSLMEANEESDGGAALTDRELLGNIFIFLIAGHETTAHTICFALGLLALHQDEQEKVHQEVTNVVAGSGYLKYQHANSLHYTACVLNETLRMFPSVVLVPKMAAEDTTLPTTNTAGERLDVFIPKGSRVGINTAGLHYNPKYWDDPTTFNPSRFEKDWPRHAFLPFSGGVRSCLGRRFAELESIAAISMIVQKYKITVKGEPEFAGETFEQQKERVLRVRRSGTLTLTPTRMPLVFTKRN